MNDPTRLDELIEQATEQLDFGDFLDEESSVPLPDDDKEDDDEITEEADESIDTDEDSSFDKEEL